MTSSTCTTSTINYQELENTIKRYFNTEQKEKSITLYTGVGGFEMLNKAFSKEFLKEQMVESFDTDDYPKEPEKLF